MDLNFFWVSMWFQSFFHWFVVVSLWLLDVWKFFKVFFHYFGIFF